MMKDLLFIPMLFACYIGMGQTGSASIIGKSIRIDNLVIAEKDFPEKMYWHDAKKACESLGKGWRLPTIEELDKLFQFRNKISFLSDQYWSASENGVRNAWLKSFSGDGYKTNSSKRAFEFNVRAIFGNDIQSNKNESNKIIGKPYKIGNLLVAQNDFSIQLNWDDANRQCKGLGAGWRLPTEEELNLIYLNRNKIGQITKYDYGYWSSAEIETSYGSKALNRVLSGEPSRSKEASKSITYNVRAVKKIGEIPNDKQTNVRIKLGLISLEIYPNDYFDEIIWEDAKKVCDDLGDGWRLPTKEELNLLYKNKEKIGFIFNKNYWSSTEYNKYLVWNQDNSTGHQEALSKKEFLFVRPVRTIN